jgi:hypothetical protein
MPEKKTKRRAARAKRQGKSPSTQAGEFVREEIHHVREGKHGARSAKQAIAIGLSKARRAGVALPPPKKGTVSGQTRKAAARDYEEGRHGADEHVSPTRSRAVSDALQAEPRGTASRSALSRQTRLASRRRTAAQRSAAARRAVRTKGPAGRTAAARKAARTRVRRKA